MTTTINASPTNGLVQTADGSGVIKVQSNGVTTNALAWLNYNCSTSTIRASYNVSSVTVNGTGDFTINFATAMTDANYAISGLSRTPATTSGYALQPETWTTTSTRILVLNAASSNYNPTYWNVSIFGN
jgi:hypothetical protein